MSMHLITEHVNRVLGSRGSVVAARMNYVDGGKSERFRFTVNHKSGQDTITVEIPAMTPLDELSARVLARLDEIEASPAGA